MVISSHTFVDLIKETLDRVLIYTIHNEHYLNALSTICDIKLPNKEEGASKQGLVFTSIR